MMNLRDKRKFVLDLARGIAINLISKSPNWPKEWDGHELRALVAEKAKEAASVGCIRVRDRRSKDFWNTIRTKNVL